MDESEDEEGFYLEYVLQSGQPAVPGGQPTGGPHLLEIVGKGARVCWPHLCQTAFVTEIAATFSHYFVQPWVSPNPEVGTFYRVSSLRTLYNPVCRSKCVVFQTLWNRSVCMSFLALSQVSLALGSIDKSKKRPSCRTAGTRTKAVDVYQCDLGEV